MADRFEYAVVAVGPRRGGDPAPSWVNVDHLAAELNAYGEQGFDVVGTVQTVERVLDRDQPVGVVILRRAH